jgi:hypothetical protein
VALGGLSALVVAAPQSPLQGPAGSMGAEDIRPGMVAIGRTVFDGTRIEVQSHILGVSRT